MKIFNSLNLLKVFTENCKTYGNLAKPASISKLTLVKFSFSVKFINNFFGNFNNNYYCFLLSGATIKSHPGKKLNKKQFANLTVFFYFQGIEKGRIGNEWVNDRFCNHFTEAENTPKHLTKNVDCLLGM